MIVTFLLDCVYSLYFYYNTQYKYSQLCYNGTNVYQGYYTTTRRIRHRDYTG